MDIYKIISNVKFNEFKFRIDRATIPNEEKIKLLNDGKCVHVLRINVLHFGVDNDSSSSDKKWLTHTGEATIKEWSESEIVKALYISLIQKLRHEASEVFTFNDEKIFNEHYKQPITIF